MEINRLEVVRDVTASFEQYERALMDNDIAVLDQLFWDSPDVVRYGPGETLHGIEAIRQFRKGREVTDIARVLENTVITTFGDSFATCFTEYRRTGSGRAGRQSQTWARLPEGWRIVAAHVSLLPAV
jgi:hypothetical protein